METTQLELPPRLSLLLAEGERKPTREVLSGCSLPEDEFVPSYRPRARGILDRGVYEDPYPATGQAEYIVVDSKGVRRRRIEMPVEDVTEDTVPELHRWLDGVDPVIGGPRRVYEEEQR